MRIAVTLLALCAALPVHADGMKKRGASPSATTVMTAKPRPHIQGERPCSSGWRRIADRKCVGHRSIDRECGKARRGCEWVPVR